jgi:hypothetical protein
MATCPPKCKKGTRCKTRKCAPFYNAKFYDIEKIINPKGVDLYDDGTNADFVGDIYDTSLYHRMKNHIIKHKYKTGDLLNVGSTYISRPYFGVYLVVDNEAVLGDDYHGIWDAILSDTYSKKLKQHGVKYKKLLDRPLPSKSPKTNDSMLETIIPYDESDIIRDLRINQLY